MAFDFNWAPQKLPLQMINGRARAAADNMAGYVPNEGNPEILGNEILAENAVDNMKGYNPNLQEQRYVGRTPQQFNNAGQGQGYTFNDPEFTQYMQEQLRAEQEAAGVEHQKAELQSQISDLEKRIADNEAKLQKWTGPVDQIAAIEARKINSQDPTSIWRWKVGQDEARRIAKEEKDKTKQLAATNAMYEIQNELDSIIVDKNLDSATQKLYLGKLANLKTLAQKNKLSTASIDAKIKEVKGDKVGETSRDIATTDFETLMNNPNLSIELLDEFEASNPNLSRADWGKLDNKRAELVNKADKKAENEAKAKERETKILGMNPNSVMSDEISFMEKRGYKRVTGDKLSDTKWVKVK
jgi:hypothetical protein